MFLAVGIGVRGFDWWLTFARQDFAAKALILGSLTNYELRREPGFWARRVIDACCRRHTWKVRYGFRFEEVPLDTR